MILLVTGCSGYVGSFLIKQLKKKYLVIGVDLVDSIFTDIKSNISELNLEKKITNEEVTVINLASTKQDHNVKASEYYKLNILDHRNFLKKIEGFNCSRFIHISSVAALDGESIKFNDNLNADNSYRSTKYIQGRIIQNWCKTKNIKFAEVLPSAIFDDEPRKFTNIGKLQFLASYLPIIPKIDVKKSLTSMKKLISFIEYLVEKKDLNGSFLAIEYPVSSVTEIIKSQQKKPKKILYIPFLKELLYLFSFIFLMLWKITRIDFKLYPNRVTKLFKDTSYDWIKDIDRDEYKDIQ